MEQLPKTAPAEIASEEQSSSSEEDFEFAFSIESPAPSPDEHTTTADDIFFNGRILPSYPLFNRQLITPHPKLLPSSSSTVAASDEYTKPDPPKSEPERCRKSSSTGSSASRKWKLKDLVVGRSRSDGKDRFVAIPMPDEKKSAAAEKKDQRKGKEMDIVTAHRIYYGKGGQTAAPGSSRRSFLPYRQELLGGLFGNNSGKHHHHPF